MQGASARGDPPAPELGDHSAAGGACGAAYLWPRGLLLTVAYFALDECFENGCWVATVNDGGCRIFDRNVRTSLHRKNGQISPFARGEAPDLSVEPERSRSIEGRKREGVRRGERIRPPLARPGAGDRGAHLVPGVER